MSEKPAHTALGNGGAYQVLSSWNLASGNQMLLAHNGYLRLVTADSVWSGQLRARKSLQMNELPLQPDGSRHYLAGLCAAHGLFAGSFCLSSARRAASIQPVLRYE
jgi:hypothetical protein